MFKLPAACEACSKMTTMTRSAGACHIKQKQVMVSEPPNHVKRGYVSIFFLNLSWISGNHEERVVSVFSSTNLRSVEH